MPRRFTTRTDNVSVPYQSSEVGGINSRTIVTSGTEFVLNDNEYAALSATAIYNAVTNTAGVLNDLGPSDSGLLSQRLERESALPPATGVSQDLFSVDGGQVLLKGFYGRVDVAIPAESIDFDLAHDPDDGGTDVVLATLLAVDSFAIGQFLRLNTTAGGALVGSLDVIYNGILASPIVLDPGDIKLNVAGGGAIGTAARVSWYAIWEPLTPGATMTVVDPA